MQSDRKLKPDNLALLASPYGDHGDLGWDHESKREYASSDAGGHESVESIFPDMACGVFLTVAGRDDQISQNRQPNLPTVRVASDH